MIPKEVTTEAVLREVSRNLEKRNKEKLLTGYRGWTWLRLLGFDDTLLQPDEEPLHHGHGSLADEDVEAGPAVICNTTSRLGKLSIKKTFFLWNFP